MKFAKGVRLEQIVVRAKLQTDDPIDLGPPVAGRDNHRRVTLFAQFLQQIQPVLPAQAEIENDQVEVRSPKLGVHLLQPIGQTYRETFGVEIFA